jgi:hypothetical protein
LEISNHYSQADNEESSEEHEDATNRGHCTESEGILENKQESVPSAATEILARKGNLDVCVLSDELDASLKACEEVRGVAEHEFYDWVILVCCLNLLSVVLKDDPDELYHCNNERAESN